MDLSPGKLAGVLLLACGLGCSEAETDAVTPPTVQAGSGAARRETFQRDESPGARALRTALDFGDFEVARELLKKLETKLGVEGLLLQARLSALQGKHLEVLRWVEKARAQSPADPRVYATAAELSAAAGRLEGARAELQRGREAAGLTPEILRTQGIIELSRPGGARAGMRLLERALQYDASLPFCARALAQGHLLLAKRALSESRPASALEAVRRSLELDAEDPDARLFLADVLAARRDFAGAVVLLEELCASGHGRPEELAMMYKRAALSALIQKQREQAIEYFRLARAKGLSAEALGSGANILEDAALKELRAGIEAYGASDPPDIESARQHFERALELDDELLLVHHELARILLVAGDPLAAATHWRFVLERALDEDLVLPEPVHLLLARALHAALETPAAREVLEAYLEREPEGAWTAETRSLLAEIGQ
jgi:Tfp pilus assembly protein PilF